MGLPAEGVLPPLHETRLAPNSPDANCRRDLRLKREDGFILIVTREVEQCLVNQPPISADRVALTIGDQRQFANRDSGEALSRICWACASLAEGQSNQSISLMASLVWYILNVDAETSGEDGTEII